MITWTNIYVSVLATLCFVPCMVFAQPTTKKQDYDSALEVRRIVERAIVAMGGQAAIDAVQDISRTLTGTRADIGQGMRPDTPYSNQPLTIRNVFDLKTGRSMDDVIGGILGGLVFRSMLFVKDRNTAVLVNPVAKVMRPSPPTSTGLGRSVSVAYRYPEIFLPFVLSRPQSLRSLGKQRLEGRDVNVVVFADPSGLLFTLFFDSKSRLLMKSSWHIDDFLFSIPRSPPVGPACREDRQPLRPRHPLRIKGRRPEDNDLRLPDERL